MIEKRYSGLRKAEVLAETLGLLQNIFYYIFTFFKPE